MNASNNTPIVLAYNALIFRDNIISPHHTKTQHTVIGYNTITPTLILSISVVINSACPNHLLIFAAHHFSNVLLHTPGDLLKVS